MVAELDDGDDRLPLSRLFPGRHRLHDRTPLPPPASDGPAASFSVGDLVWAKAFPYTWWPGIVRRLKSSSALVHLFGGRDPRWFFLFKLRPFDAHYQAASRIAGAKFSAEVALALEELGRRTLLGLMCPCQREAVGALRIPSRVLPRARAGFVPMEVAWFVRRRAVCIWGDEDADDPRMTGFIAGVIAFRRSFDFVDVDRGWMADRVVGMVLKLAVGNVVHKGVDRTLEVVMAYRKFVCAAPDWVFRDLKERGAASSSSEESEDEEVDDFVWEEADDGSFFPSCSKRLEGMKEDDPHAEGYLHDSFDYSVENDELIENSQETRVSYDTYGFQNVPQSTEVLGNCVVSTIPRYDFSEMDIDLSCDGTADYTIDVSEEELTEASESHSEVQSLESSISEGYLEEREECLATCPDDPKTRETTGNVIQDSLMQLQHLALDPCQVMDRLYESRLVVLLKFRELLFASVISTRSRRIHSDPSGLGKSNLPNPKQEVLPYLCADVSSCSNDGKTILGGDIMYKATGYAENDTASCGAHAGTTTRTRSFTSHEHKSFEIESKQVAKHGIPCEVGIQKMLDHVRFLAMDLFCLGSENLEVVLQNIHSFRHLTFLSLQPKAILYTNDSKNKVLDAPRCTYAVRDSDSIPEKQICVLDDTEMMVEHNETNHVLNENQMPCEVSSDFFSSREDITNKSGTKSIFVKEESCNHSGFNMVSHDDITIQLEKSADEDQRNRSTNKYTDVTRPCQLSDVPLVEQASAHSHTMEDLPTVAEDIKYQSAKYKHPIQASGKANFADVKPLLTLNDASSCDAGSVTKRTEKYFASDIARTHGTSTLRMETNTNDTASAEKIYVLNTRSSTGSGLDQTKSYYNSSLFRSQLQEDANKIKEKFLSAKSHDLTPRGPTVSYSCQGKRTERISPYERKLQDNQPGSSLRRLYASPLTADNSKLSSKGKPVNKSTKLCKRLHMKFPKDFKLPSKEELEKKFQVFGQLDKSRTKIFYYTGSAEIVFLKAIDAQAAYVHASKKKVYTHVDVRFWFDEHEGFRPGNQNGALSMSARGSSSNLKSCLRKSEKGYDQRRDCKVKFTVGSSSGLSLAPNRTASFPSHTEDISGPLLRLLVNCNDVVITIKEALGLESYYSIFAYAYGMSAKTTEI